jgi:hypothetical protein
MKSMLLLVFIVQVFSLPCCKEAQNGKTADQNSTIFSKEQSDSVSASHRAIAAFKVSVKDCKDSIAKYEVTSVNDTCIKYIYAIYGSKTLRRLDSLTVGETSIRLTGFKVNSDSTYQLQYNLFISDSIPVIEGLTEGVMIHTFKYDYIKRIIKRAYVGKHNSFIEGGELEKSYHESINGHEIIDYLSRKRMSLDSIFLTYFR